MYLDGLSGVGKRQTDENSSRTASPDGPTTSIFRTLPIGNFIFETVSLDHGKKQTSALLFKVHSSNIIFVQCKWKVYCIDF